MITVKRTSFFDLSHDLSHFFAYFDVLMTSEVATKKSLTLTLTFDHMFDVDDIQLLRIYLLSTIRPSRLVLLLSVCLVRQR